MDHIFWVHVRILFARVTTLDHTADLTLLHSEMPKLYGVLAVLSAIGLTARVLALLNARGLTLV